jgi:hypothetical protein
MRTIHLEPALDAGLWSGGSRDSYQAIELATGKAMDAINHNAAPWNPERKEKTIALRPGYAVVEHSIFCGRDSGLTFYVHPDDAAKLLPAPVELTELEALVLNATATYKSSYGGKDRYQMATDTLHYARKL